MSDNHELSSFACFEKSWYVRIVQSHLPGNHHPNTGKLEQSLAAFLSTFDAASV
jgi:hypothetical protein